MPDCSSCHQRVWWVRSAATGRAMPLDPDPTADGNVVIERGAAVVLPRQRDTGPTLFEQEPPPPDDRPRYTSHFATCPNAASHRKARR